MTSEEILAESLVLSDETALFMMNVDPFVERIVGSIAIRDWAVRRLAEQRAEMARGPRVKRTGRQYAAVEQPQAVIDKILAAEVNLLAGPPDAGKSLLARDWTLHVAAGVPWRGYGLTQRNCLYIAGEGTHDFAERWESQPLYERAADHFFMLDEPVSLVSSSDVDWLLEEYAEERPGLVVFDLIYHMGMADDTGTKDVIPVLAAMKRISAEWEAATLAIGHPGHNGSSRRMRGSSNWRAWARTEWHLGDGVLTCEKSKLAEARKMGSACEADYPFLRWPSGSEVMRDESARRAAIREDIERTPAESDRARAVRLSPALGLGVEALRKRVRDIREEMEGS